jgi:hypothetical protein
VVSDCSSGPCFGFCRFLTCFCSVGMMFFCYRYGGFECCSVLFSYSCFGLLTCYFGDGRLWLLLLNIIFCELFFSKVFLWLDFFFAIFDYGFAATLSPARRRGDCRDPFPCLFGRFEADKNMNPTANNMGVLYCIEPPHMVAIELKYFDSSGHSYDHGSCGDSPTFM